MFVSFLERGREGTPVTIVPEIDGDHVFLLIMMQADIAFFLFMRTATKLLSFSSYMF